MSILALRNAHKKLIDQNPVDVTITRKTKSEGNGGFTIDTSTVGPFRVRVFFMSSGGAIEVSTLGGTKIADNAWGMITDFRSEIKATSKIEDSFILEGYGEFTVKQVVPWKEGNLIVGYQAELEKVN